MGGNSNGEMKFDRSTKPLSFLGAFHIPCGIPLPRQLKEAPGQREERHCRRKSLTDGKKSSCEKRCSFIFSGIFPRLLYRRKYTAHILLLCAHTTILCRNESYQLL